MISGRTGWSTRGRAKKLWIVPLGVGAGALSWVVLASIPDIKRYIRMHEM